MGKIGIVVSIMWAIIMGVGIATNYFITKRMTTGEFYICLMMWLYMSYWCIEKIGDRK